MKKVKNLDKTVSAFKKKGKSKRLDQFEKVVCALTQKVPSLEDVIKKN